MHCNKMTSGSLLNQSLDSLEASWSKANNNFQSMNPIEKRLDRLQITHADNCAKSCVVELVNKDQSLLLKKVNNLPDLLEETNSDGLTMLNQQMGLQPDNEAYTDCDNKKPQIDTQRQFVNSNWISDQEMLRDVLLYSKEMQQDMGEIITQLQSKIINLISGYKVLKSKNILLEHKLKTLTSESVCKNCRKKKVFRDKTTKQKTENNSKLREEILKDTQITDVSLPSPPRLDPQLLAKISSMLSQSENFLKPIEQSLTMLQLKMKKYQIDNEFEVKPLSVTSDYENESDNSFSSINYYSI